MKKVNLILKYEILPLYVFIWHTKHTIQKVKEVFIKIPEKCKKRLIIVGANKPEAIYISQSKKFKLNTKRTPWQVEIMRGANIITY